MAKHRETGGRGKAARADHGEPERVNGARADRRAERTQIVQTTWWGGTRVYRGGNSGELRDRWVRR